MKLLYSTCNILTDSMINNKTPFGHYGLLFSVTLTEISICHPVVIPFSDVYCKMMVNYCTKSDLVADNLTNDSTLLIENPVSRYMVGVLELDLLNPWLFPISQFV